MKLLNQNEVWLYAFYRDCGMIQEIAYQMIELNRRTHAKL
jgi:hypothetical protein